MFNLNWPNDKVHRVVRVNLNNDTVQPVPFALRVRAAEMTDRYIVKWSTVWPHQIRDGHDWILRQHGLYNTHISEWDADPVDDLFAFYALRQVELIGAAG